MGQSSSKILQRHPSKGIVVTLDALGTIYRFREPVSRQYLKVARQCGLQASIKEDAITKAFPVAFKLTSSEYPNYGKDKLPSPQEWWSKLVHETFSQVVERNEIPQDLGPKLYAHFSSSTAFELFDDVIPFFQSLKAMRQEFSSPQWPALVLGVITNSDPRVRDILNSLSLDVGDARQSLKFPPDVSSSGQVHTPWHGTWDPQRDLDFVVTSYEADAEKPHPRIFNAARPQAALVMLGKSFQGAEESVLNGIKSVSKFASLAQRTKEVQWIHVGDEITKDILGARNFGYEALLIDRENKHSDFEGRVSSLDEVATIIRLMAQESFNQQG